MNEARTVAKTMMAQSAKTELKGRIRKIHLEASLVDMACDLCMEQVPIELAFQQIQDKAMEKMIPLLDTRILDQADDIIGLAPIPGIRSRIVELLLRRSKI